jgi:hypothetical protein
MVSFISQRCTAVKAGQPRPAACMAVPVRSAVSMRAYGQHIRVRSGLGDMLDVGRGERKALLHTFYHDLDKQKLVSTRLVLDTVLWEVC